MIANSITDLIGNTPLLKIDPAVHGLKNIDLYAKLELFNPFGSLKDRVAWGMIKDDIQNIQKENKTIIETSSGNTAKALQVLASIHEVKFKSVTNRMKVPEVKGIMQILGADVEELPGRSECFDPNDPSDPEFYVQKIMNENKSKYFYTSQYFNEKNYQAHYHGTGTEIIKDLGEVDYFIGTVGTAGSTRGAITKLKEVNPDIVSIGIAATKHDFIPGIRTIDELYEVGIFDQKLYSKLIFVQSTNAVDSMIELIRKTGVLAGPTSGACYYGTLEYLQEVDKTLKERKTAVFIVCDRMEWYVSYIKDRRPDLFGEKVKEDSIKNVTELEVDSAPVLSRTDAERMILEKHPTIIDIRGKLSFQHAHIPGSICIPDTALEQIIDGNRPFPDNMKLLLVCPVGEQSKKYAAYLKKKGYDVYSLQEGIVGWRDAGLPLESHQK